MSEDVQEAYAAIQAADNDGDVMLMLEKVRDIPLHGRSVEVPDSWSRALREKVRILRMLQDIAGDAGPATARRKPKYAKVHHQKEAWVHALEVLQHEMAELIELYIETTQKAGESVDLNLVNEVRGQLNDKLGVLGCEYLTVYYKGWSLKDEERKRLVMAWKLIGAFITKLMRYAN